MNAQLWGYKSCNLFIWSYLWHQYIHRLPLPLNKDRVDGILEHIWGFPSSRKRDHICFPAFLVLAQSRIKLFPCRPLRSQAPETSILKGLVEEFFEMLFQHIAETLSAGQWPWKVN